MLHTVCNILHCQLIYTYAINVIQDFNCYVEVSLAVVIKFQAFMRHHSKYVMCVLDYCVILGMRYIINHKTMEGLRNHFIQCSRAEGVFHDVFEVLNFLNAIKRTSEIAPEKSVGKTVEK